MTLYRFHKLLLITLALGACLAGCRKYDAPEGAGKGGAAGAGGAGGQKAGGGGAGRGGPRKFPVRVLPVSTQPVQYAIQSVGNLVETDRYNVPARVAGVIQLVNFDEGDKVTTGQELARIDFARYRMMADRTRNEALQEAAAVASAEAKLADAVRESSTTIEKARLDLELAQSEFQRRTVGRSESFTSSEERQQFESRFLLAQNEYRNAMAAGRTRTALAEAELAEARTSLASAQAALALAEDDLKNAIVRAPIAGTVQERQITEGQYVNPGTTAAMMVQTDPIRLRFTVAESRAQSLTESMKVKFSVPALPGQVFEGDVYAIGAVSDPTAREVTNWARVPNPEGQLRPGYFASVSIVTESKSQSIVVPLASVLPTEMGMICYVIQDGIAVRKKVEPGLQVTGDAIEILSGLEPGEQLVVEGMESLQENVPVQILGTPVRTTVADNNGSTETSSIPGGMATGG